MGNGSIIMGSGLRAQGSGLRAQGSGLRAQGSGLRAQGIFWLGIAVLSVVAFGVLYYFADHEAFWADELCSIGSIRIGLALEDTIKFYAFQDSPSPLFFLIAYFWYRAVPHTEAALLSLPILLTILSAVLVGIIGKKLRGARFGFLAFLFMLGNETILKHAAYEFRHYGLLLLVVSLNMYFYVRRLYDESWLNIILYGLTMCLIPYTHYLSVLICFAFFLADCLLIKKERAKLRVWTSYFIGAALFLPWAYLILKYNQHGFSKFWAPTATVFTVARTWLWLLGKEPFLSWVAVVGVLCLGRGLRGIKIEQTELAVDMFFLAAGAWASVFMVFSVYVYSAYLNPTGSAFVERYFLSLTPFLSWIMAYGAESLYKRLTAAFESDKLAIAASFGLMFLLVLGIAYSNAATLNVHSSNARETARIIYQWETLKPCRSVILKGQTSPIGLAGVAGWKELYLNRPGTPPILYMAPETLDELRAKRYDRIYLDAALDGQPEMAGWLRENYDFWCQGGFEILTAR